MIRMPTFRVRMQRFGPSSRWVTIGQFHLCSLSYGQIGPRCRTGGVLQSGGSLVGGLCSFRGHPGPGGPRQTGVRVPRVAITRRPGQPAVAGFPR